MREEEEEVGLRSASQISQGVWIGGDVRTTRQKDHNRGS